MLAEASSAASVKHGTSSWSRACAKIVDKLKQGKTFIDEARKAGVGYVVHLGSPGENDTRVAHYGWEQLVERYLEWSGIGFTHLRPQIYMQNLLGYGSTSLVD